MKTDRKLGNEEKAKFLEAFGFYISSEALQKYWWEDEERYVLISERSIEDIIRKFMELCEERGRGLGRAEKSIEITKKFNEIKDILGI